MVDGLAGVIDGLIRSSVSDEFLVGTVDRIVKVEGQIRIYIVDKRPMSMLATGESASIVRGSQVVYWAGAVPIMFGLQVTD